MEKTSMLEKLSVIADKMGSNKYLQGISQGVMTALPFIIVGAFASLFSGLPIAFWQNFIQSTGIASCLSMIVAATTNMLGVIITYTATRSFAEKFDVDSKIIGFLGVMFYMALLPATVMENGTAYLSYDYLGTKGMLLGLILAVVTVKFFKFIVDKNITIKMPEGTPPFVSNSFVALIPAFAIALLAIIIRLFFALTPFGNAFDLIYTVLQVPLNALIGENIWSIVIIMIIANLVFSFGIHSGFITGMIAPILFGLDGMNQALYAAGQPVPNVIGMAFNYGGVRFDPAILSDETGNFLYYGFCPPGHYPDMGDAINEGCYMVELEDDMCTIKTKPVCVAYGFEAKEGTDYAEHPYFEAPSIRHFGNKFYFIYSSLQGHELCYGMADSPRGPFTYKGVLISNGDLGYKGSTVPTAFYANNHGSIVKVDEDYLLFYHRHTHATHFSRQDCIEKLTMNPDGTFDQVEITSSGINEGGAIPAVGTYSAHIICNLMGPSGADKIPSKRKDVPADFPYVYEERYGMTKDENILMVRNLRSGAACAVKYLDFNNVTGISVSVRGAAGKVYVSLDSKDAEPVAMLETVQSEFWKQYWAQTVPISGRHALWFCFETNSPDAIIDFKNFGFHN